jgi:hypothetical protein
MSLNNPDFEIRSEIFDINREFLRLLVNDLTSGATGVLGLDGGIISALRRLESSQLEKISRTPLLLMEFSPFPGLCEIRDIPAKAKIFADPAWQQELKSFADRLLTCIWQTARRDQLMTSLFIGIDRHRCRALADMSFSHLSRYSGQSADSLQVRLADHPGFWPDLIRFVQNGNRDQRVVSRLAAIQLSVARDWPGSASSSSGLGRHSQRYI